MKKTHSIIAALLMITLSGHGQTLIKLKQLEQTPAGTGSLIITVGTPGIPTYTPTIPYSKITGTPVLVGTYVPYTGATTSVNLGANNFSVGAQSTLNTLYVPSTATVNGAFLSNGGARFTNGTTNCIFGNYSASIPAFWMRSSGQYTNTTNYNLGHSTTSFLINDSVKINFSINDATLFSMTSLGVPFNTHVKIGASSAPGTSSPTLDVIGTMSVSSTASISNGALITLGTSSTYIGSRSSAFPAIWFGFNSTNTTTSNYAIGGDGTNTYLQSGSGSIFFHYNGSQRYALRPTYATFAPQATSGGGDVTFQFTAPAHLAQTASANLPVFQVAGATKQFATGAHSVLYFNHFSANTLAYVGASTGTDIYNLYSDNVIQGTNATITRKWAAGFGGPVQLNGGSLVEYQGADVASVAGAITLGADGNVFEITGTNAITLISNTTWQNGAEVTLIFTSTATLTDGTANSGTNIGMELSGNANFVASADDSITLTLCEIGGTQRWREKCRSVN